jgi:maltose alpha-D-glucosyltransferase/alpha-amylase
MADSLIKGDEPDKRHTAALWRELLGELRRAYPEAAFVSEWGHPEQALAAAGFDMDFYLDHWHNGYNTLLRDYEANEEDNSFFKAKGKGDIMRFLDDYLPKYKATKDYGYISMFTCNHDTPRPARTLSVPELKLAYAFILTMPGVPFIYYGDETGMKYLDVRTKEGGYHRTGSRTPMQWDDSKNHGFSDCEPKDLYLPVDQSENAPTVSAQENDPESLLNTVRKLTALRHQYEDLQAASSFKPLYAVKETMPFVYERGEMVCAVNPSEGGIKIRLKKFRGKEPVFVIGRAVVENEVLIIGPQSFAVFA